MHIRKRSKQPQNKKNKQTKKRDRNTIDINITQMIVGKQWVKSHSMYR